jgi:arylsulfatase A-like enzyme
MDGLLADGVELQRAYAWGLCAPSRAAMQSGRHPLHVNVENVDVMNYNPDDRVSGTRRGRCPFAFVKQHPFTGRAVQRTPCCTCPNAGYQGIPLGMVTLPQLLAPAGYRAYFYGKCKSTSTLLLQSSRVCFVL